MKLQVLLSIMNEKNIKDHLKQMNIKKNYVVINQITKESIPLIKEESPFNKIISVKEKGLMRLEGKEYIMQDGDIVYFRFNVSK